MKFVFKKLFYSILIFLTLAIVIYLMCSCTYINAEDVNIEEKLNNVYINAEKNKIVVLSDKIIYYSHNSKLIFTDYEKKYKNLYVLYHEDFEGNIVEYRLYFLSDNNIYFVYDDSYYYGD